MSLNLTTIAGWDKVQANLKKVSDRVADRALTAAIRKAARPVVAAAKRNADVDSGALRASISSSISASDTFRTPEGKFRKVRRGEVIAKIGPRKRFLKTVTTADGRSVKKYPGRYAHLVEFGTASRGTPFDDSKGAVAPGNAPQPFLRPAWEQTKGEAGDILRKEIGAEIVRATKAVARL